MSKEYCKNKMTTESKEELRTKLKDALEECETLRDKVTDQDMIIGLLSRKVRKMGGK